MIALEPYLTPRQLADWLQVSLAAVRKWRAEGTGPVAQKVGASVRYDPAAVRAWLEEQGS